MSGSIGGVDASIPLRAGQNVAQPANPLQMVGNYANIQGALLRNQLLPGALQLQQAEIGQQQLGLQRAKFATAAGFVAPLMGNPDPHLDDVTTLLARAHAAGFDVDGATNAAAQTFPVNGTAAERRAWVQQTFVAPMMSVEQSIQHFNPHLFGQQTNSGFIYGTQNPDMGPNPGAVTPAGGQTTGYIPQTVTPEEAAAPKTTTDASGRPVTGPAYLTMPPAVVPPQLQADGQGASTPGVLGDGRYHATPSGTAPTTPVTGAPLPAPSGAPGNAPAIPGAGGTAFSPPGPGSEEDVKLYKTAQADTAPAQTRVQSLQKAQEALELSETGRSTEAMHRIYSFLVAQGITPGWSDDVANWDIAHKYLTDYARQQGAAAHSDLQLQTSQAANASTGISQQAALNVVKTNIGRERQKIAQTMTFQNPYGVGYGAYASKFANETDPRGFAWDTYTPQERAKIEAEAIKNGTIGKLDRSLEIAHSLGWLHLPQQQQAASQPKQPAAGGANVPTTE